WDDVVLVVGSNEQTVVRFVHASDPGYSGRSVVASTGNGSSHSFSSDRLWAMRHTCPNGQVSVHCSERGLSGNSPARTCPTSVATQASSRSRKRGQWSAAASQAVACRPEGRASFGPDSVTIQ